jgi:hypothetical protein
MNFSAYEDTRVIFPIGPDISSHVSLDCTDTYFIPKRSSRYPGAIVTALLSLIFYTYISHQVPVLSLSVNTGTMLLLSELELERLNVTPALAEKH